MAANHARGARTRSCAYVADRAAAITEAGRYAARSLRDLAEHGVIVTHESIRPWPTKFGADFRQRPKPAPSAAYRYGHLGEVFVRTRGVPHYLDARSTSTAFLNGSRFREQSYGSLLNHLPEGTTMMTSDAGAAGGLQTRRGQCCLIRMAAAETDGACPVDLQQGINVSSVRRLIAGSSLVRRLVLAKGDPAKLRIRAWLSNIDDERLYFLGLTSEDIAVLRGTGAEVSRE